MKQLRLSQVYGNNVCVGLLSKHRAATFSTAKCVVSAPSSGVKGAEEGGETPAGARGGAPPQTAKHADGMLGASTRHSLSVRTIYRSTEAACAQTAGWR